MQKKEILILLLISLCSTLFGQNQYTIIVKKGVASVSDKNVKMGQLHTLQKNDTIKVFPSSLVFITNNSKLVELSSNKTYVSKEINKLFKDNNASFNKDIIDLIKNQKYEIEKNVGSTSRGVEIIWDYFPKDGYKALDSLILLKVNPKVNTLTSDIKLFRLGDKDTIVIGTSKIDKKIVLNKPGEYHWIYSTNKAIYDNNFIIPYSEERIQIKNSFENFKKSISIFTKDMQNHLIEEYVNFNQIFF